MSDTPIDACGPSAGDDTVRALRLLARKSAASGVRAAPSTAGIELRAAHDGGQVIAIVSVFDWLHWRTKAWVASATDAGKSAAVWRLTARGRQQVRRQLSAAGEADLKNMPDQVPGPSSQPSRPGINPNESPIGWLARRRDKNGEPMISSEQLAAAERLRADFWFAGMSPRVTTNWSAAATGGVSGSRTSGADMTDNVMAATTRVRHAVVAVGPELASLLIDVCCHLKGLEDTERNAGWPLRSAKVVLQLALTRLARHYGLLADAQSAAPRRVSVRHWGAAGYRPVIGDDAS